jgi:hypothetical protein
VRVNGVEFHEVHLRSCEPPSNFEVAIRDRWIGSFALHEEFLIQVSEGKGDNTRWRPISLLELKDAVWTQAQMTDSNLDTRKSAGSSSFPDLYRPSHCRFDRIPVEGDASHVDRLQTSLTQARIRYQIVGGLDNRRRSSGHLTVAVSSLLGAGMCLRRSGFLESPESQYLLIDSRTGWKVRLLEGSPRRSK